MNRELLNLQNRALNDESLLKRFLQTRNASDPLDEFCKLCCECGYNVSVYEIVAMGEDFCDSMLRSVNGGGVEAPYFFNDAYEVFMASLEKRMAGD